MDAIIDRHHRDLLRLAHALLGCAASAQDAVQDAFLVLCRERDRLQPGALGGWLATVVRHRCLDRLRAARPQGEAPEAATRDPEPIEGDPLWSAVAALPPLERAAVLLRYRDQLDYRAIAEQLGKTVTHVGVILNQAMQRLRADRRLARAYCHD